MRPALNTAADSVAIATSGSRIEVTAEREVPAIFGQLVGIPQAVIAARAVAEAMQLDGSVSPAPKLGTAKRMADRRTASAKIARTSRQGGLGPVFSWHGTSNGIETCGLRTAAAKGIKEKMGMERTLTVFTAALFAGALMVPAVQAQDAPAAGAPTAAASAEAAPTAEAPAAEATPSMMKPHRRHHVRHHKKATTTESTPTTGATGATGATGETGAPGAMGTPGAAGSPATP